MPKILGNNFQTNVKTKRFSGLYIHNY